MSVPPIEMRWGGGKWPGGPRRRVGSAVRASLGLACDGLEMLGIQPKEPKISTVWGVPNGYALKGEALDSQHFEIYVREEFIKRQRKLAAFQIVLTLTALHEVMHCVRDEAGYEDNLLERAVSEGLSAWSEHLLAKELLSAQEFEKYKEGFSVIPDEVDTSQMLDNFILDSAREAHMAEFNPNSQEIIDLNDAWFAATYGIPAGNKVGIIAVGELICSGSSLSELVTLPPEDIIMIV